MLLNLAMINMCSLASDKCSLMTRVFLNKYLLDWSGLDFIGHLPILSYILKYSSKMTHNCLAILPADFLRALVCASFGRGTQKALRGLPATYSPTLNVCYLLTGLFCLNLTDSAPAPGCFPTLMSTLSPGTCKAPFCIEVPVHGLQLRCPGVPAALIM